jgi:hypothetical protein
LEGLRDVVDAVLIDCISSLPSTNVGQPQVFYHLKPEMMCKIEKFRMEIAISIYFAKFEI